MVCCVRFVTSVVVKDFIGSKINNGSFELVMFVNLKILWCRVSVSVDFTLIVEYNCYGSENHCSAIVLF